MILFSFLGIGCSVNLELFTSIELKKTMRLINLLLYIVFNHISTLASDILSYLKKYNDINKGQC